MKVRIFVPKEDDYVAYEFTCEVLPAVGTKITLDDHLGSDLEVESVIFIQDDGGALVPQIFMKDVGPTDIGDWIKSMNS